MRQLAATLGIACMLWSTSLAGCGENSASDDGPLTARRVCQYVQFECNGLDIDDVLPEVVRRCTEFFDVNFSSTRPGFQECMFECLTTTSCDILNGLGGDQYGSYCLHNGCERFD
ncbi:MAG: hypothetical protein HY905_26285 [Deltaproteobacteria bacterium]|nr:hypothetical protein [Deltaproteobacteria bacterium]